MRLIVRTSPPLAFLRLQYLEVYYAVIILPLSALSCVFALGVNISNYMVLGLTSPLTYQVSLSCVSE